MTSVDAERAELHEELQKVTKLIEVADTQLKKAVAENDGRSVQLWLENQTALVQQKTVLLQKEERLHAGESLKQGASAFVHSGQDSMKYLR
jgi:uncharacterized protein YacL (UPF0231 family)